MTSTIIVVGQTNGKSSCTSGSPAQGTCRTSSTHQTSPINWARTIAIPTRFSPSTMKCVKEKHLTKKSRLEIVNAVYSRMIDYAEYPTSEQYTTVCWRMIEQFEELRDKARSGIVSAQYRSQ